MKKKGRNAMVRCKASVFPTGIKPPSTLIKMQADNMVIGLFLQNPFGI